MNFKLNLIEQECCNRGITRLCHFTQSRNLAYILDDTGNLFSTKRLKDFDWLYNPSDHDRHDDRSDLISCSIEYPNTYYFAKAMERDHLFKDWVVLLIKPSYLWQPETCFCPFNAAKFKGEHIKEGIEGFQLLYSKNPLGTKIPPGTNRERTPKHLNVAPTDAQAEVLVKDPIPLESIMGVAVRSVEQAQREICRFKLQGIKMDKPIYNAPDFFHRDKLSKLIQQGTPPKKLEEILYRD